MKLPDNLKNEELPKDVVAKALNAKKREILSSRYPYKKTMKKSRYESELHLLQIELVKLQSWVKDTGQRVAILFEGRDAAGKGGTIRRLTEHMNPRSTRIVALSKPTAAELGQWYFQRYVRHLPTSGEICLFDRSWYNRGGVEKVMGFCTPEQNTAFLNKAPGFEQMLTEDGIHLVKFWLSVSRPEQLRRFIARSNDPLKQWKLSPIDLAALSKWDDYSDARDEVLGATSTTRTPWTIVLSDDKKRARLNAIKHLLGQFDYKQKNETLVASVDEQIVSQSIDFAD